MINRFLSKFILHHEKEESEIIIDSIQKGVVFRGTNLWILIFAIFIASLGLNVNSTAVIIGAMLISPLMGPIMGLGLAVGINDLDLLRKSMYNYCVATGVALATSTLFFLLSPLNEAHSEILARTAPNIYDVLIALFGGLAGIIATASKQKGNVIPGVAIATALMPPLCTAGYGLATLKLDFFVGAFYLFVINTVFIALATFLTSRFLRFPYKHLLDRKADLHAKKIIWSVVVVTTIPSIYFGYDLVEKNRFMKNANDFIAAEGSFKNDYLLNRKVDPAHKTITLVYGGDVIDEDKIQKMKARLKSYQLEKATLEVHQGFAYLAATTKPEEHTASTEQLQLAINAKEAELISLRKKFDSVQQFAASGKNAYDELRIQYPDLSGASVGYANTVNSDTLISLSPIVMLDFNKKKTSTERTKIERWLKIRLQRPDIKVIIK